MELLKLSKGNGRTRNWTFILYPESAPENWRDIIDDIHIEWVESPLHDKDLNATGEPKKPHWHILLLYESVKTYEQVKELTDKLNATIPQKCAGAKALVRYMAHLDNPDKAQYSISDIVAHGGVDLPNLLRPSASDRYAFIDEMMDYIDEHNIIEFNVLVRYSRKNRRDDWFPLLCDNSAYIINQYIKSCRHQKKNKVVSDTGEEIIYNSETGEIDDE